MLRRAARIFALSAFAVLLGGFVFGASANAATRIIYVRADAAAGGNGNSWATAYNSLQTAISLASPTAQDHVEIWLKVGVYKPTVGTDRTVAFVPKSHMTLRGGFLGTETAANQRPASASASAFTVLSGDIGTAQPDTVNSTTTVNNLEARTFDIAAAGAKDNSFNVVRISGLSPVFLDRLVIAGGYANSSDVASEKIETMLQPTTGAGAGFAQDIDSRVTGGGVFVHHSDVAITDCWIVGNFARGPGGGVVSRGGSINLQACRIVRNFSGYAGGGVSTQAGVIAGMEGNNFYGNTSAFLGGGLYVQAATDKSYVKSYIGSLLAGLAALTFNEPLPTPPANTQTDTKTPYDQAKLIKTGFTVAKTLAKVAAEKAGILAPKLTQSPLTLLATKGVGSALSGVYSWVSFGVTAVDFGVQLAILLGADPNDPFIKGWTTFSEGFAAYATPTGLFNTVRNLILGWATPSPSFEQRATGLRTQDYNENQNKAERTRFYDNRFEHNYSAGYGGGFLILRHNVLFHRSYFVENEAAYGGGAGATFAYNTIDFENSAVLRNRSTYGHSAFAFGFRTLVRVLNLTITGNHSASAGGFAVGADAGADVSMLNCVLWGNTNGDLASSANLNRLGGADLYATRKADLDEGGLKAYNDAGDSRGLFTGIIDIQNSDIEGMHRLTYGTAQFHRLYADSSFDDLDVNGLLAANNPNVGEGVRPAISGRGNFSLEPMLLQDIFPHPSSPLINAGGTAYFTRNGTSDDIRNRYRRHDRVDIGAVESDGTMPAGTIIYVNHAVGSSGNGLSWASAVKTLAEAFAMPLNPASQIWVAGGTYPVTTGSDRNASLYLRPGVSLIGGFLAGSTSSTASDPTTYPTIVTGNIGNPNSAADNSYVLLHGRDIQADRYEFRDTRKIPRLIRGIRFTGANSNAAAVRISVPFSIENCTFDHNAGGRALDIEDTAGFAYYSSGKISDTTFEANTAGAVHCSALILDVIRCKFFDNSASTGGAIFQSLGYKHNSSLKLERSLFYNNTATAGRGGAVRTNTANLLLVHSVFVDNKASPGSGDTSDRGGAGVWWDTATGDIGRWVVLNSIFYGNRLTGTFTPTSLEFQQFGMAVVPQPYYDFVQSRVFKSNDIEGLTTWATRNGTDGNVDYDPFFVNAAARNFALSSDSLLINRGADYSSPTDTGSITSSRDIGMLESSYTSSFTPFSITLTAVKPTLAGRTFILNSDIVVDVFTHSIVWEVRRPGSSTWVPVTADLYTSGVGTRTLTLTNPPHTWSGSIYRLRYGYSTLRFFSTEQTLTAPPSILYVKTSATGTGDGTTWANASTLQNALNLAVPYTQIWIASGLYTFNPAYYVPIPVPAGARVYGGFAGTETSLDARPGSSAVTRLASGTVYRLLNVYGAPTWAPDSSPIPTIFDRLTFVPGANVNGGQGSLRLEHANAILNDLTFTVPFGAVQLYKSAAVITNSSFEGSFGTPLDLESSSAQISNTRFENNGQIHSQITAGAIRSSFSALTIADSRFINNRGYYGGAIYSTGNTGSLNIQRSRFFDNESFTRGGAIRFENSTTGRIANSLFARNRVSSFEGAGGAIATQNGSVEVIHSTLVGNTSDYGSAIHGASHVNIINSIIWDNVGTAQNARPDTLLLNGSYSLTNSHVQGAAYAPFFDPTSTDYALSPHSPLLNLGGTDNTLSGTTDLSGTPRRHANGAADLGASEYAGTAGSTVYFSTPPTSQTVYVERPATFSVAGNIGATVGTTAFTWQYWNGSAWVSVSSLPGAVVSGTTLTFASTVQSQNGLQFRATAPGFPNGFGTITLTVLPRKVLRVDHRVASSGNGSTWAAAYKTIGAALAKADANTDVWIAGGDYPETSLTAAAETRIFVGFAGSESVASARNPALHPVRLVGGASYFTLVPTNTSYLPTIAFLIATNPANVTRYAERPIVFSARHNGTTDAPLSWQYLNGTTWQPISNLTGWSATQAGEISTLAHPAATLAQNGLKVRAIPAGNPEASFEATLTINPRNVLYVDADIPSSGNGSSWAHAFKTIGEAIAVSDDGSDIWIAEGNYAERSLTFVPGSNVYAGFAGNESNVAARNLALHPVRLVGNGSTVEFNTANASAFRYGFASALRSRALYINQPASLSVTRAASGDATLAWQYLSGGTWQPISNLAGWSVTNDGLVSRLSHASVPQSADGLQIRVLIPSTGETTFPVTLSVKARTTRYVNAAVSASGNGSSWAEAFKTLGEALASANDGTDVWIAKGNYTEGTHALVAGVKLYGGFAGGETSLAARNATANPVVLRAGARVFHIDVSSAASGLLTLVDSVTIADGAANDCATYINGLVEFNGVTFSNNQRAAWIEGPSTSVAFLGSRFISNAEAIYSDAGPLLTVEGSTFTQNTKGITADANATLVVVDTDFDQHANYAIQAARGAVVSASDFANNSRDLVINSEGSDTAPSQISTSTFTNSSTFAIQSPFAIEVTDSTFTNATLGLELTGNATASKISGSRFEDSDEAVRSPAGLAIIDTEFDGNVRGLVLTASGSAATSIIGSTFAAHTTAGIDSAAPVQISTTSFANNATGLNLTASADVSSVASSTFNNNTTGISAVSGLTVSNGTFTANATSFSISGGSLGTVVKDTTFTNETVRGILSPSRLTLDTVIFTGSALGAEITGGSGVSRIVASHFANGVKGLKIAHPGRAEVVDSLFTGNSGVSLEGSFPSLASGVYNLTVTNTRFTSNTGVAFSVSGGLHRLDRVRATGNSAGNVIATAHSSAWNSVSITNSLIAQNTTTGHTIQNTTGHLTIVASTIADNTTGSTVGAISLPSSGSYAIRQSILWGNRSPNAIGRIEEMQVRYALIYKVTDTIIEGLKSSTEWLLPDARNSASDPLFVDAFAGDYRLAAYSSAIDAGGATFTGNLYDLDGAARTQSTAVDLGAFESSVTRAASPLNVTFVSAPRTIVIGDATVYTAAFAIGNGRTLRWQVNDGSGWVDLVDDANRVTSYANGTSRLTIQGDLALAGTRYRIVIAENDSDIHTSSASTFSVIARPIYYVNATATGANTGADWTNAFTDLSSALNVAPAFSDIRVAAGTYRAPVNGSFQLRRRQRVLGGWVAGTDTRNPSAQVTTLSSAVGAPSSSVIMIANADQGVVDELTLIDGFRFREGGIGLQLPQGSPVVRACAFENLATGILCVSGHPSIEASTFTGHTRSAIIARGGNVDLDILGCTFINNSGGNTSSDYAGALALGDSQQVNTGSQRAVITDSTFVGNSGRVGGAISSINFGSSVVIERCRFLENTSSNTGAGIFLNSDNTLDVRASLFAGNAARDGAAIWSAGPVAIAFSTIADNHSTGQLPAAIYTSRQLTLRNSIVWGNTTADTYYGELNQIRGANGSAFWDSIIQSLSSTGGVRLLPFDPRFVDSTNGDYRLADDSPALGRANAADLLSGETDLDAVARPAGAAPDLGAFESATAPAPTYTFNLPTSLSAYPGTDLVLSQTVPVGWGSGWEYYDGSVWKPIVEIRYYTFVGPPGAPHTTINTISNARVSTLTLGQITPQLNGTSIRYLLGYQGTNYYSHAIPITVTAFDTIYVDASRPTSGDGTSWATAYKTLAEGLAAVNTARRVLHVAEGTYRGPFQLPMRFEMYGGFPAGGSDFASRNSAAHPTILTGLAENGTDRTGVVVRFAYNHNVPTQPVFDGFIVENGGIGLLGDAQVSPTLRNLVVRGHTNTGLVLQRSKALIEDSLFENNTGVDGGAVRTSESQTTFERVIFRGNSATRGGALYLNDNAQLRSVLMTGNVADVGGALYNRGGTPQLTQATIAGNRARLAPALFTQFSTVTLRNSIVWSNRATQGAAAVQTGSDSIGTPFVFDRTFVEQSTASGVLRNDPLFVAPVDPSSAPTTTGDYRVRIVSSAIDAGLDALASGITSDVVGQPRIVGTVDAGAYESATTGVTPLLIAANPTALAFRRDGTGNTFSVTATGAASILWQYAAPDGEWLSLDGVAGFSGATTAALSVTSASPSLNGYRFRAAVTGVDGSVIYSDEKNLTVHVPRFYVNAARTGSDVGDGLAWETSFRTLHAALAAAPLDPEGTEIWIAAGTYTPATFYTLRSGLSLYGGFAGSETMLAERDPAANVTVLTAATGQEFIFKTDFFPALGLPVRLDGLTLRDSPGALALHNLDGRLALQLERIRFLNLRQALLSYNATVTLRHSEIRGVGTTSSNDSPVTIIGGTALIENTLFSGNASGGSSAAYLAAVSILRHTTFAYNRGGNSPVYFGDPNNQTYNSVFWGNRVLSNPNVPVSISGRLYTARYNVFENLAAIASSIPGNSNNITTSPQFPTSTAATAAPFITGDFSLGAASLAIDAGINSQTGSGSIDLARLPRQHGLHVDPGAYEYQGSDIYALSTQPISTPASDVTPAVFTVAGSRPATFAWDVSTDGGETYTAIPGATSASLSIPGSASVDGRLYRARVQFATGPELISNVAELTYLNAIASSSGPAGYATSSVFSATPNKPATAWQWQVSIGGAAFADVSDATTDSLEIFGDASFANRTYRVRATFADGFIVTSNTVAFTYANAVPASTSNTDLGFSLTGGVLNASLNSASFAVLPQFAGRLALGSDLTATIDGNNVSFALAEPLAAGSRVFVTATSALRRADGIGARPRVWEFTVPTTSGTGIFDSPETLSLNTATALAAGDLDADGAIDLLVADSDGLRVRRNDGLGNFTADAAFGSPNASALALGSLTSNSTLDAVVITPIGDVEIWTNNATGTFALTQTLTDISAGALALGDLDADGDLDLFVTTGSGNRIFLNTGNATFAAGATFDTASGTSVALADFDVDGDLDAVVTSPTTFAIWSNNSLAGFTASTSGPTPFDRVAAADLDTDGRPDLILTRANHPARVWRNDAATGFRPAPTAPGGGAVSTLATGDIDGDGRIDLLLTDAAGSTQPWLSQPSLAFTPHISQLTLRFGSTATLVDLDGDGALDLAGIDANGRAAVSLYRITATRTDEDASTTLNAGGFASAPADVHIVSLPAHGTLLNGVSPVNVGDSFTLAQATALTFAPDTDFNGLDSFTWSATANGTAHAHWLLVNSVVDEITAMPDTLAVAQGATATTLTGNVPSLLANDLNLDVGTSLAASIVTRPAYGSLTVHANGTFTYAHDDSETRTDTFTYRVTNTSTLRYADATVAITIGNVNAAPTAIALATASGTHYTGQSASHAVALLSASDPDPEDDGLLVFSLVAGSGSSGNADFVLDGATLKTANPIDASLGLSRSVRVRATDPAGLSFDQTFNVSFTQAPTALAGTFTTNEDTSAEITLTALGGITALTFEIIDAPTHGSLSLNSQPSSLNSLFTYTPSAHFNGADSFTFRVTDGALTSTTATISLTIDPVNDLPTMESQTIETDEDTPVTFTLSASDIENNPLTYHFSHSPRLGNLTISGNTATYTPHGQLGGALGETDSFLISAHDGGGGSDFVLFTAAVTSLPDAPVLAALPGAGFGGFKNQPIAFTVSATDADNDAITYRVGSAPAHGRVDFNGASVTYVPAHNYSGADSFTIVASDGALDSNAVTATVAIHDPTPSAFNLSFSGDQHTTIEGFFQGSDPLNDRLTYEIVTPPANGTFTLSTEVVSIGVTSAISYRIAYTPNPAFNGADSLTYVAIDDAGQVSDPATITFTVNPNDLPPVASDVSLSQLGLDSTAAIALAATDPEGATLTYRIVTPPAHGQLVGDGSAAVTYTAGSSPFVGTDSFTYVANDGMQDSAVATVTLEFTKDIRAAKTVGDLATVYRGLGTQIEVLANDSDDWGDPMFVFEVTQPAHGTVAKFSDHVVYQHNGDTATEDQFTYTVSNFSGLTVTETVFISISDHVLNVTSNADSGEGTLREALEIVNRYAFTPLTPSGERAVWTINVVLFGDDATISLSTAADFQESIGASALSLLGKATIQGAGVVTLQPASPGAMRLLHIDPRAELTLKNFAFTGGNAHLGGAVYNEGQLTLESVAFTANTAFAEGDQPGRGGALYTNDGEGVSAPSVTLDDVTFIDNVADEGGGLYQSGGAVLATDATFSGHGETPRDYRIASGTFTAASLTAEYPSAPWFGPLSPLTIRSRYAQTIPVLLNPGHSLSVTSRVPWSGDPDILIAGPAYSVTGNGATRTLSTDLGASPVAGPQYLTATATGGGATFIRTADVTVNPALLRTPIARDDHIVSPANGNTMQIRDLLLSNDEDPDGQFITIINYSQPESGTVLEIGGVLSYRSYNSANGYEDSFTYTIGNGTHQASATVTVKHLPDRNVAVTSASDSDESSLRAGVAQAAQYNAQAWTLKPTGLESPALTLGSAAENDADLGRSAIVITSDVTIDGADLPDLVISPAADLPPMRLFRIAPGGRLTLRNLIVSGGSAHRGGAIYNQGTLVLENASLSSNTATALGTSAAGLGGAIYNDAGAVTLTNSTLELNTAVDASETVFALGGAIYSRNGAVVLTGSSLIDNSAHNGGGLFAEGTASATATFNTSILDNPSSIADIAGSGTVAFHRTNSTITRIDGPSVSSLADQSIGVNDFTDETTGSVPFTASDEIEGLTLSASSSVDGVIPNASLAIETDNGIHRLKFAAALSGLSNLTLTASAGGISFNEHFRVAANTGTASNPTAYPQSAGEIYVFGSVVVDPIAGKVYDSDGNQLPGGNGGASDPLGLPLTVVSVTTPAHGTASINADGRILYTHTDPAFTSGSDEFFYTLSNGFGGTVTSGVQVTIKPAELTVTTIQQLNSAIATAIAQPGTHWTIRIDAGSNQSWYTTAISFAGNLYTAFRLTAGHLTIDAADSPGFALRIGVFGPPPRFFVVDAEAELILKNLRLVGGSAYDSFGLPQGGAVLNRGTFTADHVSFEGNITYPSASGSGGALYNDGGTVSLVDSTFTNNAANNTGGAIASRNGSLSLTRVTFSGNTAASADDIYILGDGATATVTHSATAPSEYVFATANNGSVDAVPFNSPPTAAPDTLQRNAGHNISVAIETLLANDSDPDDDAVSVVDVAATSQLGAPILFADGVVTYRALRAHVSTDDTFTYTIRDAAGLERIGTVTVAVQGDAGNQSPTAANDTVRRVAHNELVIPFSLLLANDSDADSDTIEVTNAVEFSASGARIEINGDHLRYYFESADPLPASDTFTYEIRDSYDSASLPATVTVLLGDPNTAPTLDPLSDSTIVEDAGIQSIPLTGLSAGSGDTGQTLTITATSNNPSLIPHPTINYTNPDPSGSLSFTPATNASGTATVTVTIQDNGGTNGGGVDSLTHTFIVTVLDVNDAPTLAAISAPAPILEDATSQMLALSGISAGPGESQALTIIATSSHPALVPNPTVAYSSPAAAATLTFTPVANAHGTATITVTVSDNGGTANDGSDRSTRTFPVVITPVNDQPTLNAIEAPETILEDASEQIVSLSGISAGEGESDQTVTVVAVSNNPDLIPDPTVTFTQGGSTGSLRFTPLANASGTATIVVAATDDGGTENDGNNLVTRSFIVTVTDVPDVAPVLTIAPRNGGGVTLQLTGAPNTNYAISVSTDLQMWSALTTVTTDANGTASSEDTTPPAEGAARFYRAETN